MSRTSKTVKNTTVGLICTGISYILSFALHALFIRLLGLEYSGINSLFADILQILNLADLGFNNAILYKLYKTIADNDGRATEMYLTVYRKICYAVGAIVGVVGIGCIPFLGNLVNEQPTFSEPLWSLYIIILTTSVVNHFINYKSILLIAKQDRYISTTIQYISILIRNILQIIVLAVFKNIYLYLIVSLVTVIIQGIWTGVVSNKKYGLSWHSKNKIDRKEAKLIARDVGALSAYKVCRTLDSTIDTFLISKFVDISTTAIYGSVNILLNALNEFLSVFNDGMIASVGDLNATGDKGHLESVFYQSFHFTFLLYGICTATLVPFLSSFTSWWIGYSLEPACLYIMLLNFMMYGFGMNVATFRNSMGLFTKGWGRPAITAVLNLVCSLFLIQKIGLIGTILGTLIARTLTLAWYDPWIVIHHGMKKSAWRYYVRYVIYIMFTALTSVVLLWVNSLLPGMTSFISLLWHGIVYFIIAAGMLLCIGALMPEQKSIIQRVIIICRQFKDKMRRRTTSV